MVHTRVAEPADARAAAAVDVESWRAAYVDLMPADYLNDLSVDDRADRLVTSLSRQVERGKRTIVVEDDNGIFGYATVGPDEQEGVGLLYLMYVAPARWGQGGGSDLMAAATAALSRVGLPPRFAVGARCERTGAPLLREPGLAPGRADPIQRVRHREPARDAVRHRPVKPSP